MSSSRGKELERICRDGEYIVREGERSREMFVIVSGKVRISKLAGTEQVELAVLGRGDFFGEMSVLESLPRDASAISIGETKLLTISTGGLLVRMRRDPTFAYEVLHRLSGRIRALNAKLVALLESQPASRNSIMLYLSQDEKDTERGLTLPREAK